MERGLSALGSEAARGGGESERRRDLSEAARDDAPGVGAGSTDPLAASREIHNERGGGPPNLVEKLPMAGATTVYGCGCGSGARLPLRLRAARHIPASLPLSAHGKSAGPVSTELPAPPVSKSDRYPPGIPYIVGNEAAERFSYYGMRAILKVHLLSLFIGFVAAEQVAPELAKEAETRSLEVVHLFFAGVYASPMIGAILADRVLGKYRLILWVSLLYCLGHAVLAFAESYEWGMYIGLTLIAVGAGGIKPCVSANVGDQFTRENSHLVTRIYQIFYFSINFGSFFAQLLIPWLRKEYGAGVAFAVPGIAMSLATLCFWLGRNRFVKVPPKPSGKLGALDFFSAVFLFLPFAAFVFGPAEAYHWKSAIAVASLVLWFFLFRRRQEIEADSGFLSVLFYTVLNQDRRRPGKRFFDVAREKFGDEAAEGPPAVLRIMIVFSMVSVFWALFDQHSSTWITQAGQMDREINFGFFRYTFDESQVPFLNPFLVMLIIPAMNFWVYRPLERRGIAFLPVQRMTAGMFITAVSFVAAAIIQVWIETLAPSGDKVNVSWQIIQYIFLTIGEVLVSITGLEFAYTKAPKAMKSTIMGFWYLTVTIGNILVALLAPLQELSLSRFFWVFAVIMAASSVVFAVLAYFYKGKTYLQDGARK